MEYPHIPPVVLHRRELTFLEGFSKLAHEEREGEGKAASPWSRAVLV
jgi:hypothetical protein